MEFEKYICHTLHSTLNREANEEKNSNNNETQKKETNEHILHFPTEGKKRTLNQNKRKQFLSYYEKRLFFF